MHLSMRLKGILWKGEVDVPSRCTVVEGKAGKARAKKKRNGKPYREGVVRTDQPAAVQ
jgi:hypothetical protein